MKRDLITIDDLTPKEMEDIFDLADEFLSILGVPSENPSERPYRVQGRIPLAEKFVVSTLFYEPSTRTRLSFESAMFRLGGQVLSSADPTITSAVKGESLADTVRVVQNYADIIIIRHPSEGAARLAAEYATQVPVINAGDGGHEHPTQTLCDLYTLRREKQSLRGLTVLICGDLKNGRTIHSLVYALARFGASILPLPADGLDLPPHVVNRLHNDYGCDAVTITKKNLDNLPNDIGAIYMTPGRPHQLSLLPDPNDTERLEQLIKKVLSQIHVCYVTRLQRERIESNGEQRKTYPIVDSQFLKEKRYKNTHVLHPLPRVDELSYDLDQDPRGLYFKQASYGVPVRMALIASLLGLSVNNKRSRLGNQMQLNRYQIYDHPAGVKCTTRRCIIHSPSERAYLPPKFWIVKNAPLTIRCYYCEYEINPSVIGKLSSKEYYTDSSVLDSIKPVDLIIFSDEQQAQQAEFRPTFSKNN